MCVRKEEEVNNMDATAKEVREVVNSCPYCDDKADECKASLSSLKIGALVRLKQCKSESYDNCVLFLTKCLRSSGYSYGF
jgi:hypothetical protein